MKGTAAALGALEGCLEARVTSMTRYVRGHSDAEPVPVVISGLDHLVLTVADPDQTTGFCQRVLGMRPVTFGDGRRALQTGEAGKATTGSGQVWRGPARGR
jgi:hypothetical protein